MTPSRALCDSLTVCYLLWLAMLVSLTGFGLGCAHAMLHRHDGNSHLRTQNALIRDRIG